MASNRLKLEDLRLSFSSTVQITNKLMQIVGRAVMPSIILKAVHVGMADFGKLLMLRGSKSNVIGQSWLKEVRLVTFADMT
jgi:hypothetical protein